MESAPDMATPCLSRSSPVTHGKYPIVMLKSLKASEGSASKPSATSTNTRTPRHMPSPSPQSTHLIKNRLTFMNFYTPSLNTTLVRAYQANLLPKYIYRTKLVKKRRVHLMVTGCYGL